MTAALGASIDHLMERASSALVTTNYFEAEALSLRALDRAALANDFERMARICLPLQEARRQKRHEAIDAGRTFIVSSLPIRGSTLEAGCYLVEPPLIGIEANTLREMCNRKKVPALVLCREPTTSAGKWPLVGVGGSDRESLVIRVQVTPAQGFGGAGPGGKRDDAREGPPGSWFLAMQEKLGDAAIEKLDPRIAPDYRALDVLEYLRAVPDHEKLHQALEQACRDAMKVPPSDKPRRRAVIEDPLSF